MKKITSIILSLLLLSAIFTAFGSTAAAATEISNTNPVITADSGETVSLSGYSVVFDGEEKAASDISWKDESGKEISEITPEAKGVTKLTASSNGKTMNVYVVAKEKDEKEYVLFEADFSEYSDVSELKADGFITTVADSYYSFADGALVMGDTGHDYVRLILPEWLGDFGDYSISTEIKMLEVTDTARWFGLVYRIQNENNAYYPYYHMCIRENTTAANGIEFAERTSANAWNVASTGSGKVGSVKSGYHTVNIKAFEDTVQYIMDDESVLFITDAILGVKTESYEKGAIGITMNYGKVSVKNIRVTVQESAPEQPKRVLNLINNSHEANNLINPIANVQKLDGATATDALSAENAPGSVMLKVSEISDMQAFLTKCSETQTLPTFVLESKDDVAKVNSAMNAVGMKDANAVSSDADLLAMMRTNKPAVRTGLIVDLPEGELTNEQANEIRKSVRKAPATFCLIKSEDADYEAVDELQELAVAVWVEVDASTDSREFAAEALRAVTSGANGIVTDNASELAKTVNSYLENNTMTRTPVMIGHRGNPGVAPENTLSGFIKAYENGADVFEVDVEVTKDGEIIIMHDGTLNRTTTYTGTKTVNQMTLEEIKAEFILGKDGKPTEEKVPTLAEVFEEFKDKDCKIFVEFKGSNALNIQTTCDLIKKYKMEGKVDVISFNTGFLNLTVSANNIAGMSTGYLHGPSGNAATVEDALESLYTSLLTAQTFKSTINPSNGIATKYYMQAATDRGMTVWPWTYTAGNSNVGFLSGCDGVTTDDMQWVTKMAKYLTVADDTAVAVGSSANCDVSVVTYGGQETSVSGDKLIVKVISGGEYISVENGAVTGISDGVATVMYGYRAKTTNGSEYVLYTQPVTVTVGNTVDETSDNGQAGSQGTDSDSDTVIIVIAVAVIVIAVGVCAYVLFKKKK